MLQIAEKRPARWPESRMLPGAASLAAILLLIVGCSL
jgi:hypothetical protein